MKVTRIFITGYKNLIDCELTLSDFNVLIGANNTGKSNFLDIFNFLNILLAGSDQDKAMLFDDGFTSNGSIRTKINIPNSNEIVFKMEFEDDTSNEGIYKYEYYIDLLIDDPTSGHIINEFFKYKKGSSPGAFKTIFERKKNIITKIPISKIQSIDNTESVLTLINKIKDIKDTLDQPVLKALEYIYLICKTPVLYSSSNEIRESFVGPKQVVKNGRIASLALINEIDKILSSPNKDYFLELLSDILDIRDIQVNKIEALEMKWIHLTFHNGIENSAHEVSDGTLIVLNLVTSLISNKHPLIAIEEIENSIHPKLLKKLVSLIKYHFSQTQIIITTHSPVLLNMVSPEDVSIITKLNNGSAYIEYVKTKKDLIKKLSTPFSSFGDIFYLAETDEED